MTCSESTEHMPSVYPQLPHRPPSYRITPVRYSRRPGETSVDWRAHHPNGPLRSSAIRPSTDPAISWKLQVESKLPRTAARPAHAPCASTQHNSNHTLNTSHARYTSRRPTQTAEISHSRNSTSPIRLLLTGVGIGDGSRDAVRYPPERHHNRRYRPQAS